MYGLVSVLILFLVVLGLVVVYHLYLWGFSSDGVYIDRSWVGSFECGFASQRVFENYFSFTYFVLLVFFVVFDLEVSLLLNIPYQEELYKNLGYYLFFLFILSVGFSVEIYNGYVNWSS